MHGDAAQAGYEARRRDDLALARRCVAGERAAQRELYARELDRVHRILWRILGPSGELEDVVQEAMIEVFRSLAAYRGESTLGTWIDRVTTRVAWAAIERGRRPRPILASVPEPASDDPSADRRAEAREAARRLYEVLDRLEVRQRVAFTLHVIEGREMREVAAMMEASLVATKTRVWRARREVERRAAKDPLLRELLQGGGTP
jgi:RNA polymerase sigma-70 factor (ECF subfamily)